MIQRCSLPEGCPKHSPWGAVDHGERLAEGVFFVSTPSHGGFKLAAKHNVLIPAAFRRDGGWYEEDCDAAIPRFFMPLLFKPEQVLEARKSLRCWHWRAWEGRLRTVLACYVFGGPAMPLNAFSQPGGILDVNRLHARNISTAELVRGHEFGPDPHVLFTHGGEFASQFFI